MPNELLIRVGLFAIVFAAVALWEASSACRVPALERRWRWPHNLGLLLTDIVVLRLVLPGAAIAVALAGERNGWGLMHWLTLPGWLTFILSIVLLDLFIYVQHVMFHAAPTLWRLHRVHHSDLDVDVTTATRFHPVEIVISMAVKAAAVAAIGASAEAVLVFEVLLNATAMFNHANARLPGRLERLVRGVLVTPDMHRIHHSIVYNESASNFGFSLSWWDRLFGTYRQAPAIDHATMILGVDAFREKQDARLDRLLIQPLLDSPGGYAINRRPEPAAQPVSR
jgi:sterol desaturase/sphingolipid hydroxylase (fatty acid hydroxylase superfamily)